VKLTLEPEFRAVVVRVEMAATGSGERTFRAFSRFLKSEEEMERFWVRTVNMLLSWKEMPLSMVINRQMSDARVNANGIATQRNRPKPMIVDVLVVIDRL